MYLRTSRLDLDNYNNDTEDGLHITSMAGTWLSVVKGFGGMRVRNSKVHFAPFLPEQFKSIDFKIKFRGALLDCNIQQETFTITNEGEKSAEIVIGKQSKVLSKGATFEVKL